jgi:hypothetical protein
VGASRDRALGSSPPSPTERLIRRLGAAPWLLGVDPRLFAVHPRRVGGPRDEGTRMQRLFVHCLLRAVGPLVTTVRNLGEDVSEHRAVARDLRAGAVVPLRGAAMSWRGAVVS